MSNLTAYILKRLAQFFFVIFTGITLAFFITNLSPVDPVEQSLSQLTSFGASDPRAVEMMRESLSELYGLQGNIFEQYLNFWGRILTGDFGPSLSAFPTPVITLIAQRRAVDHRPAGHVDPDHLRARQPVRCARRLLPARTGR